MGQVVSDGLKEGDYGKDRSTGGRQQPGAGGVPILSARGVVKTYVTGTHQVPALCGIDIDVAPGELVMVMGPSGNGKTTLLNCLSGLDDIDDGVVYLHGEDLFQMSDAERTRHRAERMGFVFQAFNLIPVLSAKENVELPLLVVGVNAKEARERSSEMLERVGLANRGDHLPGELSGGEQQRVSLARALISEPAIVWADEPTGALDTRTAGQIVELLHEVHAAGQTLVVVTHDEDLGRSGERLVLMRDGFIVHDGHPRKTHDVSTSKAGAR
jgi:putative ABC transport system ATP-binding protein